MGSCERWPEFDDPFRQPTGFLIQAPGSINAGKIVGRIDRIYIDLHCSTIERNPFLDPTIALRNNTQPAIKAWSRLLVR